MIKKMEDIIMNKTELIANVAKKNNLTKKEANAVVDSVFDAIVEALSKEEKVQIVGFGTFEVRVRGERQGRDPRTNTPMTIPASKAPAFKAGKAFKDAINK